MKRKLTGLIAVLALSAFNALCAQTNAKEDLYVDYQKYFNEISKVFTSPSSYKPKTAAQLQSEAAALAEESPYGVTTISGKRKLLSDEDIYAERKNTVFIVGKFFKGRNAQGEVNLDLTGTAFGITRDGICVSNYHMLKDIIRHDSAAATDSAYFIITYDKQVYFIEKVLAYSQNNDLAVFKVNTQGAKIDAVSIGDPGKVGATVYCISHPVGYYYYYSKGIVARNAVLAPGQLAAGYNPHGKPPIRMEITADYGIGSSGGPVFDRYGMLVGIISATSPLGTNLKNADGSIIYHQQMVLKDAIPVEALLGLLKKN